MLPSPPHIDFQILNFDVRKKRTKLPELGSVGGFRWFGQCSKEKFFFVLMSSLTGSSFNTVILCLIWTNRKRAHCIFFVWGDIVRQSWIFYLGSLSLNVSEGLNEKKMFSFEHCPNHLNPPTPIRATWSFFRKSKFKIWKSVWTKNTIYTIWYTVYMQPKKQLKVQYIGIFEEIDSFYWPKMHF